MERALARIYRKTLARIPTAVQRRNSRKIIERDRPYSAQDNKIQRNELHDLDEEEMKRKARCDTAPEAAIHPDTSTKRQRRESRESEANAEPTNSYQELDQSRVQDLVVQNPIPLDPNFVTTQTYVAPITQQGENVIALFMNKETYEELKEALDRSLKVAALDYRLGRADSVVGDAYAAEFRYQKQLKEDGLSPETREDAERKLDAAVASKKRNERLRKDIDEQLSYENVFLRQARTTLLNSLEESLVISGLYERPVIEEEPTPIGSPFKIGQTLSVRSAREDSKESIPSERELRRQEARQAVETARDELDVAHQAFYTLEYKYAYELKGFKFSLEHEEASETQTNFDLRYLTEGRQLTGELKRAETAYRWAKRDAREIDAWSRNTENQVWSFVAQPDDGIYRESDEVIEEGQGASRDRIETWLEKISTSEEQEVEREPPGIEADAPWEFRSVSFASSIGVIDYSERRELIDWWNETCRRDR